jgi:hypothetical protein
MRCPLAQRSAPEYPAHEFGPRKDSLVRAPEAKPRKTTGGTP